MSDVKNLYILKQNDESPLAKTWAEFAEDNPELFEPLDLESLTTQLKELTAGFKKELAEAGFGINAGYATVFVITSKFERAVLELIGMKGKQ